LHTAGESIRIVGLPEAGRIPRLENLHSVALAQLMGKTERNENTPWFSIFLISDMLVMIMHLKCANFAAYLPRA